MKNLEYDQFILSKEVKSISNYNLKLFIIGFIMSSMIVLVTFILMIVSSRSIQSEQMNSDQIQINLSRHQIGSNIYVDLDSMTVGLPLEIRNCIVNYCNDYNVPYEMAFSILMNENPSFNVNAINKNNNGSCDLGLFQINTYSFTNDFSWRFWSPNELSKFNYYNYDHNSFIAIKYMAWCIENTNNIRSAIIAYNSGLTAVIRNKIPSSSIRYADTAIARIYNYTYRSDS